MARGNIFILIHADNLNDEPPSKTKDRYTWVENVFDTDGEITGTITNVPTWAMLSTRYEQTFGVRRNNIYTADGQTYHLIEFETSFVKGEVQQLLAIGNPGNFPHGAILSAAEAAAFLDSGGIDIS